MEKSVKSFAVNFQPRKLFAFSRRQRKVLQIKAVKTRTNEYREIQFIHSNGYIGTHTIFGSSPTDSLAMKVSEWQEEEQLTFIQLCQTAYYIALTFYTNAISEVASEILVDSLDDFML